MITKEQIEIVKYCEESPYYKLWIGQVCLCSVHTRITQADLFNEACSDFITHISFHEKIEGIRPTFEEVCFVGKSVEDCVDWLVSKLNQK